MNKEEALKLLLAHAYCCITGLKCSDCPMCIGVGRCKGWENDDIYKAVSILRESEGE